MENNYQDEVAKILIAIESIKFSFKSPFTLTSGHKSPVYVDCRKIISYTKERNKILEVTHDNNIFTRPTWKLLHKLPMYRICQTFNLNNTNWLEDRIVCLPSSAE